MKLVMTVFLVVVLFIISCIYGCVSAYRYNCDFSQYIKLADDAGTPELKLQYLKQYRDAVSRITRENARYIFTQKQYTKSAQLLTLNSLIVRLEQTSKMEPASMQYQQAMTQITGQEFDNVVERIDGIFWDCYRRENIFRWVATFSSLEIKQD